MTEALRRMLWLLPVLAAGAILLFFTLGHTHVVRAELNRPLFYNPTPLSAEVATEAAVADLLSGTSPDASARLNELGGAALPVILAKLPSLPVQDRRKVAEALWPLAHRMGLSQRRSWLTSSTRFTSLEDQMSQDERLLFWERYGDEHALDLRPLSVSRLVKRMSQRDTLLRNPDLMAVDTYALPTLVSSLGRVTTEDDISRCRRIVKMIAHVTGQSWSISDQATLKSTRDTVTEIRKFWDERGPQWTSLNRFELLVARLSQTEFATWIFRTTREISGLDSSSLFERFSKNGAQSVWLFSICLFGLLVVGPIFAATISVLQLRESRWKLERFGLRGGLAAGLISLVPFVLTRRTATDIELALSALLMGAMSATFVLHRELNDKLDWRTHHVLKSRPWFERVAAVARWLAPSVPTMTPMAVAEAALWVTCLELATGSAGLGRATVEAMAKGDLYWLMAVCLGLGVTTGAAQTIADLFLGSARWRRGEGVMVGLSSLASLAVALLTAGAIGPVLGRLATQWFSGRGLNNLLTEVRGAFLPFLIAPLIFENTTWDSWLVIGLVVGAMQAISVGRWVARRTGEWSPALLGGIALGQSRAALLSAHTMARGAVVGTMAGTMIQIIVLEALLSALNLPGCVPVGSVGHRLYTGAGASALFLLALAGGSIFATELLTSWLFQRRANLSTSKSPGANRPDAKEGGHS